MPEQSETTPQIDAESVTTSPASEHAGRVVLDRLADRVRDEAIDGIPVVRDPVDAVVNIMRRGRLFSGRRH